jgi:uncharacterized protein
MNMEKQDKTPNKLFGQSSPYLLQHQYNPVQWYPWGEEALEKARSEDKLILVSIGYSTCHWCHVMERESFEDQEVANLMNQNFVCIKVDREERPDIDHLYLNAVQLISGHGGWPLNCFALPDGRPFWGGTYFPKDHWKMILGRIAQLYKLQREDVQKQAQELTNGVASSSFIRISNEEADFSRTQADAMFSRLISSMDNKEGGRKGAPKFPMPGILEFLLQYYNHSREPKALQPVILSLRKMAMGGIYDQIAGGFSRYSVDDMWKIPHFEKMLYDNAQLVSLYSHAWTIKNEVLFKDVVYQTLEFIERELTSPDGVFYSALDADSEGVEGKFYVWKQDEIRKILDNDADLVMKYYNVGGRGLWEHGNNVLLRDQTEEVFAGSNGLQADEWRGIIRRANKKLLKARNKRIRPGLDNKVLVGWNGLMIKALADAYFAFGEDSFLDKARKAADYILGHAMEPSGKLSRTLREDQTSINGFLEDYALFIKGLIRLYEVSTEINYLLKAKTLVEYVLKEFDAGDSLMFRFSPGEPELAAPFFEFHDGVIPSSNSVMGSNLFYLGQYFEQDQWSSRSTLMLGDLKDHIVKYSGSFYNWGILLLHHVFPFYTLVICGPEADKGINSCQGKFIPHVLIAAAKKQQDKIPVFHGRFAGNQTWFYLCSMGSCRQPVQSFEQVATLLGGYPEDPG